VLGDVRVVLGDVGGVHDEKKVFLGQAIDEEIVDKGARGAHQARVMRLTDLQLRRVVARDLLDRVERIAPGDLDLAHVADVEDPRPLADGKVLGHDAGILDRHVPAAETDHLGARGAMAGVERRLLERGGGGLFHAGAHDAPDAHHAKGNGTMCVSARSRKLAGLHFAGGGVRTVRRFVPPCAPV
jgi:hypothetical protein